MAEVIAALGRPYTRHAALVDSTQVGSMAVDFTAAVFMQVGSQAVRADK